MFWICIWLKEPWRLKLALTLLPLLQNDSICKLGVWDKKSEDILKITHFLSPRIRILKILKMLWQEFGCGNARFLSAQSHKRQKSVHRASCMSVRSIIIVIFGGMGGITNSLLFFVGFINPLVYFSSFSQKGELGSKCNKL